VRMRHGWLRHGLLWIIIIVTYYPLLFVVQNSFKNNHQFTLNPFSLPWPMQLDNYAAAWDGISGFLLNTVWVASVTVILVVLFSALASYAFSRFEFYGKRIFFSMFVGLLMIPGVLTIIPLFFEVKNFQLSGSEWALILPYVANGQAISIFILRSFFDELPEELFEAGRVDGAGEFYLFWRISVPLSLPILGAVAILTTLSVWGDFLWPVVALDNHASFTISAGINYFASSFGLVQDVGPVFASYVLATLPVVVLIVFTMRTYISGLTSGAIKA
jgi:raffinose/stachyose/melibiose transport system permease protein